MSTTSRNINASQDGNAYTTDLNDALAAVDTCHAGATAPTDDVLDGKLWLDTSGANPILKIYRGAWVHLFTVTSGGATLEATVQDDSHNHVIDDVDGLQAALDAAGVTTGNINQDFSADVLNIGGNIDLGDWTITEASNSLYFANLGVNRMKLDASGNMIVFGNITAYNGAIT